MPSRRAVCGNFKKIMLEDYEDHDQDIIRSLLSYIGFIMEYSPKEYNKFTQWQIDDMCMSTHNDKVDVTKLALETLWRYTRRGGKSQKLTALASFAALMDLKVVWRATFTDQLGQASEWFNMNPFVRENKITSQNKIGIYNSPNINISVLSEAKIASRGADWLFYDEGGWCFNDHKKHEYYVASRPMIAASGFKRITHASTPAKQTAFHEAALFLEREEFKLKTKLQSWHPWGDCSWISKEWVDQERELHADCPWYVDQNYEALWVIYGGAVFTNIILEGDSHHPEFPYGFLENMRVVNGITNWGVDFNGEDTQHFRIGIIFDDYYVYVLEETKFLDLWELDKLEGSIEVEEGLFNTPFTDQLRRMGLNVLYAAWGGKGKWDINKQQNYDTKKQGRVNALQRRKIVINKETCPTVYNNLVSAANDKNSRLPKLAKRPDQHGLDGLLHAIHENTGVVVVSNRSRRNKRSSRIKWGMQYNELKNV